MQAPMQTNQDELGGFQRFMIAFFNLGWYELVIKFIFTFVAKTSELLLAAGIVVSTANFLADGKIMQANSGFGEAWAWAQALAIDSSLGIVFVSVFLAIKEREYIRAWIFAALVLLLALVAGLITNFDSLAHASGLPVGNINVSGWMPLWVMSALRALAVIGFLLSSRLRDVSLNDVFHVPTTVVQPVTPAIPAQEVLEVRDTLARLESRLDRVEKAPGELAEILFQRLQVSFATQTQSTTVIEEGQETKPMVALPPESNSNQEAPADRLDETIEMALNNLTGTDKLQRTIAFLASNPGADDEALAVELGLTRAASARFWRLKVEEIALASGQGMESVESSERTFQATSANKFGKESKGPEVKAAIAQNPDATDEEIARQVGCTARTVRNWRSK